MRKFQKTLFISISLEHLPMTETDLKQFCIEWDDSRFQNLRPTIVLGWKTEPLALGRSRLELEFLVPLRFWNALFLYFFSNWYSRKEKDKLTETIRSYIFYGKNQTKQNFVKELWNDFWNKPISLVWLNLGFTKISMDLELESKLNLLPNAHLQSYEGEKKLYFRTGYLKTITYRLTKKVFKTPYPKFAEMYIKTRDKHSDESLGKVYYSFLGYLLETKSDEYLLSYFGFHSTIPESIRNQIPNEIWQTISPQIQSEWMEPNLLGNELEFRTVYQVSTSSQNHPR
ncbi:hypothetical protein EHQ68_00590 [Leptospira congkakensis]|uniref:Uncharacterized protein n=1 Tax=Leptospira congkakensis TaxID=2484932 RepID=A0A4Z1A904_9LEPT|nr:hypothetical protein [Leptospira congkakensis]TGL87891.1 hypothetical protein EHQ69_17525 [Leptospira congkakensis]TGL92668.1 hypothetical protein EHQ68_00590 [Leptospira congkakensis]TGL96041.1 hypothetical protein EHQ70_13195 [Leptospira congkakensis]